MLYRGFEASAFAHDIENIGNDVFIETTGMRAAKLGHLAPALRHHVNRALDRFGYRLPCFVFEFLPLNG